MLNCQKHLKITLPSKSVCIASNISPVSNSKLIGRPLFETLTCHCLRHLKSVHVFVYIEIGINYVLFPINIKTENLIHFVHVVFNNAPKT